jgi:hypothetical protein
MAVRVRVILPNVKEKRVVTRIAAPPAVFARLPDLNYFSQAISAPAIGSHLNMRQIG